MSPAAVTLVYFLNQVVTIFVANLAAPLAVSLGRMPATILMTVLLLFFFFFFFFFFFLFLLFFKIGLSFLSFSSFIDVSLSGYCNLFFNWDDIHRKSISCLNFIYSSNCTNSSS